MKKIFLSLFLFFGCVQAFAQVNVTQDTLPETNSADSTAILNNNLRLSQNAINAIGGYFNSNGYLSAANGGTGTNISTFPNGSLLIYNSSNVGIGTFGQGSAGATLVSGGAGAVPVWGGHGTQIFLTSGTFTAPTGVSKVYLTAVGAGAGGGGSHATNKSGGGGGGGMQVINYPYTVTGGNNYTVTINAGGAGGAVGNDGSDGGTTVFDSLTIQGGKGGKAGTAGTAGNGGIGGTTFKGPGLFGNSGGSANDVFASPDGGGTIIGVGATAAVNQTGNSASANTGAGGAGGASNDGNTYAGGAGGTGIVIVQY